MGFSLLDPSLEDLVLNQWTRWVWLYMPLLDIPGYGPIGLPLLLDIPGYGPIGLPLLLDTPRYGPIGLPLLLDIPGYGPIGLPLHIRMLLSYEQVSC